MSAEPTAADEIVYPDSDEKPMADNTLQWDWMVKIVGELREMFAGKDVFVAGDLLWYPVKDEPKTVMAPDALVAFGRPAGYRGSYKQWEEAGVAPQVVFEVMSPSNTREEMAIKQRFCDRHGVDEYYVIDPYKYRILGWVRDEGKLQLMYPIDGYVSPLLGVRFEEGDEVRLFTPDGREFCSREERIEQLQDELRKSLLAFDEERERVMGALRIIREEEERANQEREHAIQEREWAGQEHDRAEREKDAKDALAAKLRELGVDPDTILKPAG